MNKHASSPYNPNIAHVFYLAGFIESWGRGIEKICSACKKDGVPQPEYTINPGDIMIKFTAPEDRVIRVTERLSVSRKTVAARLKKLKEAGLIERIGSDRKGYWKLLK